MSTPTPLDEARREHLRRSFTLRRVPASAFTHLLAESPPPRTGDLVIARVRRLGQHTRLQLTNGRRAVLFEGDEIALAYGDRYAPDQFEARVPADLRPCHLVAAGGVAGEVISRHASMKRATEIEPLGLVSDAAGEVQRLQRWSLPERSSVEGRPPLTVGVVGTSMNAGKTTTAMSAIRGLRRAGLRVAAAKVTGTGAGGDYWSMVDAGARPVLDFTDAGYATTRLLSPALLESIFTTLLAHLLEDRPDAIVLEVADGLFQAETAALLESATFRRTVDSILFAASDPMGAAAGVAWLRERSLPVRAITGPVSGSSLGGEETRRATGLPVLSTDDLRSPEEVLSVLPVRVG